MQRLELPAFDEPSWQQVDDLFGRNPGIYRVKVKNASGDGYEPIRRLLGIDSSGLLYIGMSDAIISRFGGLRAGIYGAYRYRTYTNPAAHGIGVKMAQGFSRAFSKERIFIEIEGYSKSTEVPKNFDAWRYEADAIGDYIKQFGEPPPFNDTWGTQLPSPIADE